MVDYRIVDRVKEGMEQQRKRQAEMSGTLEKPVKSGPSPVLFISLPIVIFAALGFVYHFCILFNHVGEVAVVDSYMTGKTECFTEPGMYRMLPGSEVWAHKKTQTVELSLPGRTRNGNKVTVDVSVRTELPTDAEDILEIYRLLRHTTITGHVEHDLRLSVFSAVSTFSAMELYHNRAELADSVMRQWEMRKSGLYNFTNFVIYDVKFSRRTVEIIEKREMARQRMSEEKIKLQAAKSRLKRLKLEQQIKERHKRLGN